MSIVTANELKKKGVSSFLPTLKEEGEVVVTVRGKPKYLVLPIQVYQRFREYELTRALEESHDDIKKGRIFEESVDAHMKRIES